MRDVLVWVGTHAVAVWVVGCSVVLAILGVSQIVP